MIKKLVCTLFVAAIIAPVWAQSNGFKYDFGEKESSFNPNPGTSSTSFMPKLTNSANKAVRIRVRTSSDGTGEVNLVKKGASFIKGVGLEIVAGTSTSKLSFYNITAKAVSVTSFHVKFDESAAGQWIFANGNSSAPDDLFQGNSAVKETSSEIFAGLRWNQTEENEMKFYTRNGAKWSSVKSHPFVKNTEYFVEIYSNNSAETQSYNKDGANSLNSGTYHVWVNGKRLPVDFATGGLETGKNLSGIAIYGVTPKGNSNMAKAWFDDLQFEDSL